MQFFTELQYFPGPRVQLESLPSLAGRQGRQIAPSAMRMHDAIHGGDRVEGRGDCRFRNPRRIRLRFDGDEAAEPDPQPRGDAGWVLDCHSRSAK